MSHCADMKSENIVKEKSFNFAVRIVNLYKHLRYKQDERVMSVQILRSGTSIGANICEALRSSSRKDFVAKMNISLKEAYETEYWIELLYKTDYLSEAEYNSIFPDCRELTNILSKIILTTKSSKEKEE